VVAKDVNPTPDQLRNAPAPPADLSSDTYVPPPYQTKKIQRLAAHITAGRTTAYGEAVAIQQWFTAPDRFKYTLDVSPKQSPAALINFLTVDKRGYCQQFAFAMAVLARLVGIPARVVIGYTQGGFIGNNTWQVKTSDAHAWPELYFQGAGWLRFEPTPPNTLGPAGQATASAPPYSIPLSGIGGNIGSPSGLKTPSSSTGAAAPASSGNSSLNKLKT